MYCYCILFCFIGRDKLLVSSINDLLLSNNGSHILKSLVVTNPIAKMIIDSITTHHQIYGDGSISIILMLQAAMKEVVAVII